MKSGPAIEVKIYRMILGTCTDITSTVLPDQSKIISMTATAGVDGKNNIAMLKIDNSVAVDIKSGDAITISMGWVGGSLTKIFAGEVSSTDTRSKDEDKTLLVNVKDWSFLFLTDKFTQSYPVATNSRNILIDILANYISSGSLSFQADVDDGHLFTDDPSYTNCHNPASAETIDVGATTFRTGQKSIGNSYHGDLLVDDFDDTTHDLWSLLGISPYLRDDDDINKIVKDVTVQYSVVVDDSLHVDAFVTPRLLIGWTGQNAEPWIHDNDDTNRLSVNARDSALGSYANYFTFHDYACDSFWFDSPGFPELHLVGKKHNGTGGRCNWFVIRVHLYVPGDATDYTCTFPAWTEDDESYHDHSYDCSGVIPSGWDIDKFNGCKIGIEFYQLDGGGDDKGECIITQAYWKIQGWKYTNQQTGVEANNWIEKFAFDTLPLDPLSGGETISEVNLTLRGKVDPYDSHLDHSVYVKITYDEGAHWTENVNFTGGSPWIHNYYEDKTVNLLTVPGLTDRPDTITKIKAMKIKIQNTVGGSWTPGATYNTKLHITQARLHVFASTQNYNIWRAFLYFDTSAIPDDAEIISSNLTLYPISKTSTQNFDLCLQKYKNGYTTRPSKL
jgi:hypothetical protein